jgi:exonuclease III
VGLRGSPSSAPALSTTPLVAAAYNLQGALPEKAQGIAVLMNVHNIDILVLNEHQFPSRTPPKYLTDLFPRPHFSILMDGVETHRSVAIITRRRVCPRGRPKFDPSGSLISADYTVDGRAIRVIAANMPSGLDYAPLSARSRHDQPLEYINRCPSSPREKRTEAERLRAIMTNERARAGADITIALGDLNESANGELDRIKLRHGVAKPGNYRPLNTINCMLQDDGWTDAYRTLNPHTRGFTRFDGNGITRSRLDYALVYPPVLAHQSHLGIHASCTVVRDQV